MKHRKFRQIFAFLLTLALCCGMFAGCGRQEKVMRIIAPGNNGTENGAVMFNAAMRAFKKAYPDVQVEVVPINGSFENQQEQLSAQYSKMMAGDGPDLVFVDYTFTAVCDIYKACLAGAFEDLNPYFEADSEWSWDGCNTAAIEGMQLGDKQYLMPLYYDLPVLLTEQSVLEQSGFDLGNCTTGSGMMQEMADYYRKMESGEADIPLFEDISVISGNVFDMFGQNPIRYDTQTIEWPEDFSYFAADYKTIYPLDSGSASRYQNLSIDVDYPAKHMQDGRTLFFGLGNRNDFDGIMSTIKGIANDGTPVMVPIYGEDGGKMAAECRLSVGISNSSKFKDEAFAFIKILLSEEIQSTLNSANTVVRTPVNENAIRNIWNARQYAETTTATYYNYLGERYEKEEQPLSEDWLEQYLTLTRQVSRVYLNNHTMSMYQLMNEYFEGTKSYEAVKEQMDDKLGIYITE